ncbi:MAG: four helix bundle protein [Phycisphaerae bacterium]|nr:four helix bundle protein [Phycisphaerae bacterium]
MKTKSFKDLIVWQKSYALCLAVYRLTRGFPKSETYGFAYGSLLELETQFLLARDLKYIDRSHDIEELLREVGRMLYRMLHPKR